MIHALAFANLDLQPHVTVYLSAHSAYAYVVREVDQFKVQYLFSR
jgi:hypothetical protein